MASAPTFWHRCKSLKLPWRKQWLCGQDLAGNTFWEFVNPLAPNRPRRIVRYSKSTHNGDVILTPAWLQWLRHTRERGPTVHEQQVEVQRQENVKVLAQRADERWREKESFLDKPKDTGQELPLPTKPLDKGGYERPVGSSSAPDGVRNVVGTQEEVVETADKASQSRAKEKQTKDKSPWETHRGTPSQGWQPEAWTPGKSARR
ncbi:MAG: hypothetical protein M1828_002148 [Chrysothrix sp. TS-e1954]|nr:MAG: hypothetical protein M1828_002148 [Chrysothrix sp. TS-e1954]